MRGLREMCLGFRVHPSIRDRSALPTNAKLGGTLKTTRRKSLKRYLGAITPKRCSIVGCPVEERLCRRSRDRFDCARHVRRLADGGSPGREQHIHCN